MDNTDPSLNIFNDTKESLPNQIITLGNEIGGNQGQGHNLKNLVHIYDTLNAHVFRVLNSQYGDGIEEHDNTAPMDQQ